MGLPDGTSAGSAEPKRETLALKETLEAATPGPWYWEGKSDEAWPSGENSLRASGAKIERPGWWDDSHPLPDETVLYGWGYDEADARLIALAPELAALVLDMGEELRRSLPQDESMDHGRDPDRRALLARLDQLGKEQR